MKPEKGDGSPCQEAHKALESKAKANPGSGRTPLAAHAHVLTESDSLVTADVPRSAKQNAKRVSCDRDLARVIEAWADLPETIKAAILAIIETATEAKGDSARTDKE